MKKLIGILVLLFALYQSVYFESWKEHQQKLAGHINYQSRCEEIVKGILNNSLVQEEANLINGLNRDFKSAKIKWGNRLGIGESAFFLVKGQSKIVSMEDGQIQLASGGSIDTKYLFGNAVRDASRLVKLEDFHSQKDLNALTEALNSWLREKIIPSETNGLKIGDEISYVGAVEVGPLDIPLQSLTIFPVAIQK